MNLRNYQTECLAEIERRGAGRWLIHMATGLGKTATFTHIPRNGRMLILAHRKELISQPASYFPEQIVGIEQGPNRSSGQEIVIGSVQSMMNRLDRFSPDDFDIVIIDECHHYASDTFRKVVEFFQPRLRLGFTATPNRADGVKLDDLFDEIIFSRDIRFGIQNEWLARLHCKTVDIGYDLSNVTRRLGDFAIGELEREVNIEAAHKAIKQAVEAHAVGPTIIFCCTKKHAIDVANYVGGKALLGDTPNRQDLLSDFGKGNQILTTVQVLTEGVDLPCAQTAIMARPTQSDTLYTQMVGRILRPKEMALVIDCVGNYMQNSICRAPSLLGIDLEAVAEKYVDDLEGDLLIDIPEAILHASNEPESWIKATKMISLIETSMDLNFHDVNYQKMPDGSFVCFLPRNRWVGISKPDDLDRSRVISNTGGHNGVLPTQQALDLVFQILSQSCKSDEILWHRKKRSGWKNDLATEDQLGYCKSLLIRNGIKGFQLKGRTKEEIGIVISRLKYAREPRKGS